MYESELVVNGMTCTRCEHALRAELGGVPGVIRVDADAATGQVQLQHDGLVERAAIKLALAEAGYSATSWTVDRS